MSDVSDQLNLSETGDRTGKVSKDAYKTAFDLTVLVLAHLLLLPVWVLCWIVIPILIWVADRGPVFYKQGRIGKNGKLFVVRKFRTMVPDAGVQGPAWTTEGDPRVTRVGRILRRMALDELPQTLNIWKREMSLVGPRALDVEEQRALEERLPGFNARLQILPGLTGLAQVYDHTDDDHSKLSYDMEYLKRMSPMLDLWLLVRSAINTLTGRWDRRRGKSVRSTYPNPPAGS